MTKQLKMVMTQMTITLNLKSKHSYPFAEFEIVEITDKYMV
jgi:hypothetical protein